MPDHECSFCHGVDPPPKACSGCRNAWYCRAECQRADWTRHKLDCKPSKPVTTADYLALAVDKNLLPEHPQTCTDYGFTRTTEKSKLLGLYIGLMKKHYLGVKPQTLHKWRLNGTLVENIKAQFQGLPEGSRGEYYLWFLRNQHVVSGAGAEETLEQAQADEMIRRAWLFIGRSPTTSLDDIRQQINSASEEENVCFVFYAMLLSKSHPGPIVDHWINFGFCACNCQEAEMELARSYISLINQCTFKQFLEAYSSCSLVSLFQSKDINITDPFIIDVLSGLGGIRGNKSVWDLKQYIELKSINGPEDTTTKPCNSVMVDYGFFNCRTSEENKLLFDLYKRFFTNRDANPFQLHQACIQGRLFTYFDQELKLRVKPKKTYERLLANPYPLADL